jgi:hypothetical protein
MPASRITVGIQVLVLAVSCGMVACSTCANRVLEEFRAPGGKNKVVIFERDCGATTGYGTHVSLVRSNAAPPTAGGNILVLDDGHGAAPSNRLGVVPLEVAWVSDASVVVRYPKGARVFRQRDALSGVQIKYELLLSAGNGDDSATESGVPGEVVP